MPVSVSKEYASTVGESSVSNNQQTPSTAAQGASRAFQTNNSRSFSNDQTNHGANRALQNGGLGWRPPIQRSQTDATPAIGGLAMERSVQSRKPSPSQAAALLAHRRAASSQDLHAAAKAINRSLAPPAFSVDGTSTEQEGPTSPSTKELVQLYEDKANRPKNTQSVRYVNKATSPIRSPVPLRPTKAAIVPPKVISDEVLASRNNPSLPIEARSGVIVTAKNRLDPSVTRSRDVEKPQAPQLLAPRRIASSATTKHMAVSRASSSENDMSEAIIKSRAAIATKSSRLTVISPLVAPAEVIPSHESTQSLPLLSREAGSFSTLEPSRFSKTSYQNSNSQAMSPRPSEESTRPLHHHMSVDSLANAIVASSLASSRAPSPKKLSPMPPPPPHRLHLFHRNKSQEQISRTPSPAKTMRHTLRAPANSDDEAEQKGKGKSHFVRKHPNKHHEGDRKRWRTQVTDIERRRYEGVWAANKGVLLSSTSDNAGLVLNIVVRDIWQRSRLADDILEEVWELVNVRDSDRLSKEEFVVGMFLIDQRLKGNKLPTKVSESMWNSVRRLEGIKIPKQRHRD